MERIRNEWTRLQEWLYLHAGEILAARSTFIQCTNVEPTVLILPPALRYIHEPLAKTGAIIFYNMAVIIGDVEEPTLGFGVSLVL